MPATRPRHRPSPELSRRSFLIAAGGAGAAAVLAGCGSATEGALPGSRVGPGSPQVLQAELARRGAGQRTVDVALDAVTGPVDIGARTVATWSYGGEVPGTEIRVRRGDLLRAQVSNHLPAPTTVHWHGVALRNDMDGVPVLTQPEIAPGAAMRYAFTVPDPGTYWLHPHVGTQLDRGLQAPLIIEDPADGAGYDQELVVVFDDWLDGTGRTPDQVLTDLRAHGMGGGMGGSGGMAMAQSALLGGDAGDVTYPFYLANGRTPDAARTFAAKPGQRIRLRMINAGGDTAFRVGVPGSGMTITHTDGFPVTPTQAQAVLLGMGERVDAVITMPATAVPLLGLAEGKNGTAALLLQPGHGPAPDTAVAATALMSQPVTMPNNLRGTAALTLPTRSPDVVADMKLAGPGNGYTWTINDQTYDPNRGVPVHEGQRVRLRFINTTTMFHPMHLHGHTFQIHTPNGPGPRKDTAIVRPSQTLEVDFDADNPGQWLTHCHNIYHGEAGMMTVISYLQ
ncbi:multicopper oxidase family protein [uncultured Pseudonocardia sp.]|jgi:FtsP/CotA-like multicopper oxidase with cupredoxin domain|uniref:multicopper oxidase family protein n=1 Tax=uncultured Pseudonocardia sp. TaxID=211455 RepID=UPI002639D4D6|nr:multicopper oxidase family protein [uncultured Pseudonocardia sp.]